MAKQGPTLTDPQERFALALAQGLPQTIAARVAGYYAPHVAGVRLARTEHIRERVAELRRSKIDRMASEALGVLRAIMLDRAAPTSDRRQAATHVLALAGHVPAKEAPRDLANLLKGKAINEYTAAELEAFIEEEKARRAGAARPIIDQTSTNPTPTGPITLDQVIDLTDQ